MNVKDMITNRQREVLDAIHQFILSNGYAPTLSDLRKALEIKSNQAIIDFLELLEKKGYVQKEEGKARSIKITAKGYDMIYKLKPYDYQQVEQEHQRFLLFDAPRKQKKELTKIVVFKGKNIRKTKHNNEWWFVLEDVVMSLVDSTDIKQYINKIRQRDEELSKGWVQIVHTLPIETEGGIQKINCANTEGIFRIIQSIPSPKAEPFKIWLAKVGYERVQEIEDPELATKRARAIYKAKGYPDAWIEKRMRGIHVREELTNEWSKRGVTEGREYAILTAEISKATFDMTPNEYKELKGLEKENLRDHMTDLELIFSMLEEASTTEIARNKDAQGLKENVKAAKEGGSVAGNARIELERKSGKKIATPGNYLDEQQSLSSHHPRRLRPHLHRRPKTHHQSQS